MLSCVSVVNHISHKYYFRRQRTNHENILLVSLNVGSNEWITEYGAHSLYKFGRWSWRILPFDQRRKWITSVRVDLRLNVQLLTLFPSTEVSKRSIEGIISKFIRSILINPITYVGSICIKWWCPSLTALINFSKLKSACTDKWQWIVLRAQEIFFMKVSE